MISAHKGHQLSTAMTASNPSLQSRTAYVASHNEMVNFAFKLIHLRAFATRNMAPLSRVRSCNDDVPFHLILHYRKRPSTIIARRFNCERTDRSAGIWREEFEVDVSEV